MLEKDEEGVHEDEKEKEGLKESGWQREMTEKEWVLKKKRLFQRKTNYDEERR